MKEALALLAGYLIGSVPFALVIGKRLYGTDVRQYGSGNLGATNAGRTLGLPAFVMVSLLDGAKGFVVYLLVSIFNQRLALLAGIAVVIGHCYPLFAQFKGGKGVATSAGLLLAISLRSWSSLLYLFIIPSAIFILIALTTRYISLASMTAFTTAVIMAWLFADSLDVKLTLTALCLFVIYKHHENIRRLLEHRENRFSFKK